jgi:hypothetical protein
MKHVKPFLISLAFLALSLSLSGCGAGPQPIDEGFVANAQTLRQVFDSVGGDYSKVSAEDRAKLLKLYPDEQTLQNVWKSMQNPPLGGSAPLTPQ